jgi:hypothetical protein
MMRRSLGGLVGSGLIGLGLIGFLLAEPLALQADTFTIGTLGVTENCLPFGCPEIASIGTYQQLYSSSDFSGPVSITDLTFYNSYGAAVEGNSLASGTYTFSLSTTSKVIGGLDTVFANNLGADNQLFFAGALGGPLSGNSFTVSGTPFSYDPAAGNLLLTIEIDGAVSSSPNTFFDANPDIFGRMYLGGGEPGQQLYGLVTTFGVSPVPEPGYALLCGIALAFLTAAKFRTRSN